MAIEGVKVKALRVVPDERGRLMEILRCDDPLFEKFGQVYVTTVYPGVVKAWHYHKIQTDNIAVVPKLLQWPEEKIRTRTNEMLQMIGLNPGEFSARYPHQLSGGQNQRVGVARALAADPPIALMDEPFGALDPVTREGLQDAFLQLQRLIKKTIVFVTHDVFEAVKLGDRVALLDEGRLQQLGTPANLARAPSGQRTRTAATRSSGPREKSTRGSPAEA